MLVMGSIALERHLISLTQREVSVVIFQKHMSKIAIPGFRKK